MSITLNTVNVSASWTPIPPSTTYNANPSVFKQEIPAPSVMIPKSLSYQFRVAEYEDESGKVVKVGLQYMCFEHDNYGVPQLRQDWTDVERVRMKL